VPSIPPHPLLLFQVDEHNLEQSVNFASFIQLAINSASDRLPHQPQLCCLSLMSPSAASEAQREFDFVPPCRIPVRQHLLPLASRSVRQHHQSSVAVSQRVNAKLTIRQIFSVTHCQSLQRWNPAQTVRLRRIVAMEDDVLDIHELWRGVVGDIYDLPCCTVQQSSTAPRVFPFRQSGRFSGMQRFSETSVSWSTV
jgi:hypothetical protein